MRMRSNPVAGYGDRTRKLREAITTLNAIRREAISAAALAIVEPEPVTRIPVVELDTDPDIAAAS